MSDRVFSAFVKQKIQRVASRVWVVLLCVCLVSLLSVAAFAQERKGVTNYTVEKEGAYQQLTTGDLYAVVIGVSRYASPKIPQLNYSDKDARDFAQFLQNQERLFRHSYVNILLNEQATSVSVKKQLVYGLKKAGKDDTVVLFLSGHGADDPQNPGEYFFITHDADPDNLEATSLNLTEMKFMKRLDTRRVVLIADTCHAGGFSMHGAKAIEASFRRLMSQFKESEGKVILTSCRPHEISMEKPGLNNSVFTHFLLEGLRGSADANGDGIVSLQEVYEFVYQKAKDETGGIQHPQLDGRIAGVFPLSLSAGYRTAATSRPLSPTPSRSEPGHENELAALMQSAEKGDADAQFLLGMIYRQGRLGLPRNQSAALKWLEKAAQGGHAEARAMLASIRVPSSTAASALGDAAPAASPLPPSLRSADSYVRNLWRRANQGETAAQYVLAFKFEHGGGVARNLEEAIRWYKAAAAQGDSDAAHALRRLRANEPYALQGSGVVSSSSPPPLTTPATASGDSYVQNLRRRANSGEATAQYILGYRYEHGGQGISRDRNEAIRWYKAAAAQGDSDAAHALRRLGVNVPYPRRVETPSLPPKKDKKQNSPTPIGQRSNPSIRYGSGGYNGVDSD